MKGLLYPYDPVTKYVSKFCLNLRGCLKSGDFHKTARSASFPKYPSGRVIQEVMDTFYKELNIHNPSTKNSNNPPKQCKTTPKCKLLTPYNEPLYEKMPMPTYLWKNTYEKHSYNELHNNELPNEKIPKQN